MLLWLIVTLAVSLWEWLPRPPGLRESNGGQAATSCTRRHSNSSNQFLTISICYFTWQFLAAAVITDWFDSQTPQSSRGAYGPSTRYQKPKPVYSSWGIYPGLHSAFISADYLPQQRYFWIQMPTRCSSVLWLNPTVPGLNRSAFRSMGKYGIFDCHGF